MDTIAKLARILDALTEWREARHLPDTPINAARLANAEKELDRAASELDEAPHATQRRCDDATAH